MTLITIHYILKKETDIIILLNIKILANTSTKPPIFPNKISIQILKPSQNHFTIALKKVLIIQTINFYKICLHIYIKIYQNLKILKPQCLQI